MGKGLQQSSKLHLFGANLPHRVGWPRVRAEVSPMCEGKTGRKVESGALRGCKGSGSLVKGEGVNGGVLRVLSGSFWFGHLAG